MKNNTTEEKITTVKVIFEDRPSTADILKITASEAAGFYKLIVTVASSFLGGSLVYFDKVVRFQTKSFLWFLYAGWLALVISICAIIWTRRLNLKACSFVMKGSEEDHIEAQKFDNKAMNWSTASTFLLALGMCLLMCFGAFSIYQNIKIQEKKVADNENKKTGKTEKVKPKQRTGSLSIGNIPSKKSTIRLSESLFIGSIPPKKITIKTTNQPKTNNIKTKKK